MGDEVKVGQVCTVEASVIRKDGTIEDLGTIYDSNNEEVEINGKSGNE